MSALVLNGGARDACRACGHVCVLVSRVGKGSPALCRFAHAADCELICFARKRNLDAQLRQNNTTGKSVKTCPAFPAKIFRFRRRPNQPHNSARLTQLRDASRSSRTCGEMRWTREARETYAPDAYGEVVWSGRRGAGVKSKRSESFSGATVARKPFTGESSK